MIFAIMAEAALADIPALVTSDTALLDADQDGLAVAFADGGLPVVRLVHPARMASALRQDLNLSGVKS